MPFRIDHVLATVIASDDVEVAVAIHIPNRHILRNVVSAEVPANREVAVAIIRDLVLMVDSDDNVEIAVAIHVPNRYVVCTIEEGVEVPQ